MLGDDFLAEIDAAEIVLVYLDQIADGSVLDAWTWLIWYYFSLVMVHTHGKVVFWLEWAQFDRFFCLPVEIWQRFDGRIGTRIGRLIDTWIFTVYPSCK